MCKYPTYYSVPSIAQNGKHKGELIKVDICKFHKNFIDRDKVKCVGRFYAQYDDEIVRFVPKKFCEHSPKDFWG